MKNFFVLFLIFIFFTGEKMHEEKIKLPEPVLKGKISFEEVLYKRRSVRKFKNGFLNLKQVAQLLWACYGITDKRGFKTTPSAGATYPLEIYLIAGDVSELKSGVYKYLPDEHSLIKIIDKDIRRELMELSLRQKFIKEAQITIVITADFKRTTSYYGDRGIMYVHMEAGHSGQNIYLQAEALGLGTVAVGAFNETQVSKLLNLPKNEKVLYIFPIGFK